MFYTYAHYKPEGGLFYIGKGKRRRAYAMDGRNSHWQNIVNKYGRPCVKLLASWDTEEAAFDHEKVLIASFRDMGFELANKSDGGEGTSGYKHTEECKRKNSLAKMGNVPWNKGTKGVMQAWNKGLPMSDEQRLKFSVAKIGKTGNRLNKVNSEEHRLKISLAKKGKRLADEVYKKQGLSRLGKKQSIVTCPHCKKEGGNATMPRWHFDKCKQKEIQ